MFDLPQIIAIGAVWLYWTSVLVMIIRSHLRFGASSGTMPRALRERVMWLIWVPAILLWQVVPVWGTQFTHPFFHQSETLTQTASIQPLRWIAAIIAVGAYALTIRCWLWMGRNWSMAVVPGKQSQLITSDVFSRVRHPIYGLSIVLMLTTLATTPSWAMLCLAATHVIMNYLKTVSEEKYLREKHPEYTEYAKHTGRFFPSLFTSAANMQQPETPVQEEAPARRAA